MARKTSRFASAPYVDIHGRPLDISRLKSQSYPAPAADKAASEPRPDSRGVTLGPQDIESVFEALCLAGVARGKTWLTQFLRHLECRHSHGHFFQAQEVADACRQLVSAGRAVFTPASTYEIPAAERDAWFERHLEPERAARGWPAWARASSSYGGSGASVPRPSLHDEREGAAFARLLLYAGLDASEFASQRVLMFPHWNDTPSIARAAMTPFMADRFERLDADLRAGLLTEWARKFNLEAPIWIPLMAWLDAQARRDPDKLPLEARFELALARTERADTEGSLALLKGLKAPPGPGFDEPVPQWDPEGLGRAGVFLREERIPAFHGAVHAVHGRWTAAAEAFALSHKALCAASNTRRGVLPASHMRLYLLSLIAQPSASAWTAARKLAMAESGSRKPAPSGWGLWAHAVAARMGDASLNAGAFDYHPGDAAGAPPHRDNADRLVLAAWVGQAPAQWQPADVQSLVTHLERVGCTVWADLVRQAAARFGWSVPPHTRPDPPWPVAFFGGPREAWRDALDAITALGEQKAADAPGEAAEPTLRWQLTLDAIGRVVDIEPFERPASARSRARPKAVPLSRLQKSTRLDPRDAAVARCIGKSAWPGGTLGLDIVGATMALVHHPGVTLDDDPDRPVELREALPELEVRRTRRDDGGEAFEFHLMETLVTETTPELGDRWTGGSWASEVERRNTLRVLRDGDDRARLIRITPAQRRVAELVRQRWSVPVEAKAELEAALKVLAGHFQLHSDAAAGQRVDSDAHLVAQLVPRGEALQLRLLARPFGRFGPLVTPGQGRARLLTVHEGLQLSTERDLAAEAEHLAQTLDALPFLHDLDDADASWLLEDPQQALHALELLPALPGVAALEWPRGKAVRVISAGADALTLKLRTARDWFALEGELRVDEHRVLGLQRLMDLAQSSRQGRFIPLGEGEYLALTERLRAQLADLQAMSTPGKAADGALRLPAAAASFVDEVLEGTPFSGDTAWTARVRRLQEAASLQPRLPGGLQAELRDYQVEGYAWLIRSAHAGLGVVLADDMGLGKTVQTLALLLARAAMGPALVIAPTSVCANWVAEAARFAPGLRVQAFGEGDRTAMLEACGPGDLVVASYALTLIESDAFAAREWATLVLDEAQALKNAATQRAKTIAALKADFRLALSGTPVENRLADLWSIVNLLNPGLLGSAAQFTERFAAPIERHRDDAARSRLRRLVAPLLLRRTKAQVLSDLPSRTEIIHRVEPGAEEKLFLEALRRSAIDRIAGIDPQDAQATFHVLAELTRLRRAACDPRLAAPELGLIGAKVQEFERLAVELVAGRHKALVFSQFTDFLDLLAERLRSAGISFQMLTGSTPAAERAKRVAAFQAGEGDLFLISLKAGGFGLNLTAADYVLIVDPWWNPAAEDQASGRAHRIGQQRPVTVYRLVTAGSIEERIIDLHRHKRDLADGILAGQDQGPSMRAEDLRELLGET